MAERTISTRIVLDGEAEYRSAIKQISAEWKTYQANLKAVEADIKANGASVDNLTRKEQTLMAAISAQQRIYDQEAKAMANAQSARDQYAKAVEEARARLDALNDEQDEGVKSTQEYKDAVAAAQGDIAKYSQLEKDAEGAVQKHAARAADAETKIHNLTGKLKENSAALDEEKGKAEAAADGLDKGKQSAENMSDAIDALTAVLVAGGVKGAIDSIKAALQECVQASIQFESAMAGVAKTTNLSDAELADMGNAIKELSTTMPITTTEFAGIVEVAGQLGIAKDALLDFSKVMANLGVATNMTSEEAATMLAQFAAVTGMDSSKYENLGASIVALGNNFATNELKITEFAQAIAGAGKNAGLSEAQMLALGTAVTSMGIEAGTGGNNMAQLIQQMQNAVETGDKLEAWAEACNMSTAQLSATFKNDAAAAILAFVQGVNSSDKPMSVLLDNLGITQMRATRMVTSLANAEKESQMLSKAIALSNSAWEEANALQTEAATRYATTQSQMSTLQNSVNNLKIAVGDELSPAVAKIAGLGAGAAQVAQEIVEKAPWLVDVITALTVGGIALSAMLAGYVVVSKLAKVATEALTAAMASNPYGAIAIAIAAAVTAITAFIISASKATDAQKELEDSIYAQRSEWEQFTEEIKANKEQIDDYIKHIITLTSAGDLTAAQIAQLKSYINLLNDALPELGLSWDDTTQSINMTTDAIQEFADQTAAKEALDEVNSKLSSYETSMNSAADSVETAKKALADYVDECAKADFNGRAFDELTQAEQDQLMIMLVQNGEYERLVGNVDSASAAYETAKATYDEATESIAALTEQIGDLNEKQQANAEMQTQVDTIKTAWDELTQTYEAAYQSAYESIRGQMGLFGEMGEAAVTSYDDMKKAIQSQIDWQNAYSTNLNDLMTRNGGKYAEFAKNFMDGTKESAGSLASFSKMTDEQIDDIIAKMEESKQGTDALAQNMASASTDFEAKAEEIKKSAQDTFTQMQQSADSFEVSSMLTELSKLAIAIANINNMKVQPKVGNIGGGGRNSLGGGGRTIQGFAVGLERVPYDDFPALLHRDEMVLTAAQAAAYRAERSASTKTANIAAHAAEAASNTVVNLTVTQPTEAWTEYIFKKFDVRLAGVLAR